MLRPTVTAPYLDSTDLRQQAIDSHRPTAGVHRWPLCDGLGVSREEVAHLLHLLNEDSNGCAFWTFTTLSHLSRGCSTVFWKCSLPEANPESGLGANWMYFIVTVESRNATHCFWHS